MKKIFNSEVTLAELVEGSPYFNETLYEHYRTALNMIGSDAPTLVALLQSHLAARIKYDPFDDKWGDIPPARAIAVINEQLHKFEADLYKLLDDTIKAVDDSLGLKGGDSK